VSRFLIAALVLLLIAGCGGGGDPAELSADRTALNAMKAKAFDLRLAPRVGERRALAATSSVDPTLAASQLFDFAEASYGYLFPSRQNNRVLDGLVYRYYPESGAYLAVIDWRVFVLGGPFGAEVQQLGYLTDFITPVDAPPGTTAVTASKLVRCPNAEASTASNFFICMEGYVIGRQTADSTKACTLTVAVDGQITLTSGAQNLSVGPDFGAVNFTKNDSVGLFRILVDSQFSTFNGITSMVISAKETANSDFFTEGGVIQVEAKSVNAGLTLTCDLPVTKG